MTLSNNTILITGGGAGIGLSLAEELLKHGNKVIIAGRNIERLKHAQHKFPALEIIQCDISNENDVKKLVQQIQLNFPDLNFLINNVGLMKMWNIQKESTSISEQKEEILTNIFGTFQLTQSLIKHLLKQKQSCILNISSVLAFVPMSATPIYNATKAAIHSYSISIRQQLQNTSIKVFEVIPGPIDTQMTVEMDKITNTKNSSPKMLPGKLALLIVKGLQSNTPEIRPGIANMLYHIHRLFPSVAQNMLRKQSEKMLLKL